MNADQFAHAAYLILFLIAIGGYYLVSHRNQLGQTLRQAALWGVIFLGAIAVVGLWPNIRASVMTSAPVTNAQGQIELRRAADGHFHLTGEVNGTDIRFIVDTGATDIVLSQSDARRAGFDVDNLAYTGQARTANGTVALARVTIARLVVSERTDRNVPATVNGGEMQGSLLGMAYLNRFTRLEIEGNRLILTP